MLDGKQQGRNMIQIGPKFSGDEYHRKSPANSTLQADSPKEEMREDTPKKKFKLRNFVS